MQRNINQLFQFVSLALVLWGVAAHSIAQGCQVVAARPEIALGSQRYSADADMLFTRQELTVTAECAEEGPITLLIDGESDVSGQYFRFGTAGRMLVSLLSMQYNGRDTELRLSATQQEERRVSSGQSVILSPGSQLTTLAAEYAGDDRHLLTLQLRLDFPATGNEGRVRDLTELDGQIRFEVYQ
ncbi:Uncharacterised protein [Pragia fontium]|uniref:hypothetical protein n=1 Tax=Pragia fontium TaxID=82985 RepID=UPI000DFBE2E8|nr:hypothetical protein [Pragia fontium]SUB81649.1 Uncharacterised protein [Pragia fontium]